MEVQYCATLKKSVFLILQSSTEFALSPCAKSILTDKKKWRPQIIKLFFINIEEND